MTDVIGFLRFVGAANSSSSKNNGLQFRLGICVLAGRLDILTHPLVRAANAHSVSMCQAVLKVLSTQAKTTRFLQ